MTERTDDMVDVVVIGGGPAGLSGALALARSRRSVLVIDAGEPRNATAGHAHNFLTRDGVPPDELRALGADEVRGYGAEVTSGRVESITTDDTDHRFAVRFDGRTVRARRLLMAAGSRDELPEVAGLRARWGRDVLHCPYCHGWEVRDQRIAVLATGPTAMHQALMFRQLSDRVVLLAHTGPELSGEQREQCVALGIEVVEGEVTAVTVADDRLTGVSLVTPSGDQRDVECDAVVIAPRFRPNAELLAPLGLAVQDMVIDGHVVGGRIETDLAGATSVPGVWVAGNVADPMAQLMSSAAQGLMAGAAINGDLVMAEARDALGRARYSRPAWEARYAEHSHLWSGRPNPTLVTETAHLTPGRALDAGAGEGADAIWLAAQGWTVTGIEFSRLALERAVEHAAEAGQQVEWRSTDLVTEEVADTYDLVTTHFLHVPRPQREKVFARLAAAVAPGGTLLVVGHDLSDMHSGMPRPGLADAGWAAQEVADGLGDGWTVEVCEARQRQSAVHDGTEVTVADAVLRAVRS